RVDVAGYVDVVKVPANRHHPKVLGSKRDLGVIRISLPGCLFFSFCFAGRCHGRSSVEMHQYTAPVSENNCYQLFSEYYCFLYGNEYTRESSSCQGCICGKNVLYWYHEYARAIITHRTTGHLRNPAAGPGFAFAWRLVESDDYLHAL